MDNIREKLYEYEKRCLWIGDFMMKTSCVPVILVY